MVQRPPPRVLALALFTVALPRARPTPRPLVPLDRNMGAFLSVVSALFSEGSLDEPTSTCLVQ